MGHILARLCSGTTGYVRIFNDWSSLDLVTGQTNEVQSSDQGSLPQLIHSQSTVLRLDPHCSPYYPFLPRWWGWPTQTAWSQPRLMESCARGVLTCSQNPHRSLGIMMHNFKYFEGDGVGVQQVQGGGSTSLSHMHWFSGLATRILPLTKWLLQENDPNNFIVGCEEGAVYSATR